MMSVMNVFNMLHIGKQSLRSAASFSRMFSLAAQPIAEEKVKPKTGIVMLNMGGPTHDSEVAMYLTGIMTDSDMIQLPFQSVLGPWIAKKRTQAVSQKYKEIGGGSPILKWTNLQGELLCKQLDKVSPESAPHKHYVAFRYVQPSTEAAFQALEKDGVDHAVIFSQYPQYSCATSGSSFNAIYDFYRNRSLPRNIKWSVIDRWATNQLFVKSIAQRIKEQLVQFPANTRDSVILLFSAHSLPMQAVFRGDSYPSEIGATVQLVMQELNYCNPYSLVWQSKVGPKSWLAPFTDDAIKSYVKQGKKDFILVPVAFVNEHIETLHELDIEYCQELAEELRINKIRRAAAPNDHPLFIDALTDIVVSHLKSNQPISKKFLMRCPHCSSEHCSQSKAWYAQLNSR